MDSAQETMALLVFWAALWAGVILDLPVYCKVLLGGIASSWFLMWPKLRRQ